MAKYEARFQPIPSTGGKYEMTIHGKIRNVRTGFVKKLSVYNGVKQTTFFLNGKSTARTLNSLLFEVFGVIPKHSRYEPIPVTLIKSNVRKSFPSIGKAIAFLAQQTSRNERGLWKYFCRRVTEIDGWQIRYREPEKRKMLTGAQANRDSELRR